MRPGPLSQAQRRGPHSQAKRRAHTRMHKYAHLRCTSTPTSGAEVLSCRSRGAQLLARVHTAARSTLGAETLGAEPLGGAFGGAFGGILWYLVQEEANGFQVTRVLSLVRGVFRSAPRAFCEQLFHKKTHSARAHARTHARGATNCFGFRALPRRRRESRAGVRTYGAAQKCALGAFTISSRRA
jgi:hypothetical protein